MADENRSTEIIKRGASTEQNRSVATAAKKVIVATRRDQFGEPTALIETTPDAADHWRIEVWRSRP